MRHPGALTSSLLASMLLIMMVASPLWATQVVGRIVDGDSGKPLAARVYIHSQDGNWLFVETTDPKGSALAYREQWVPMPNSVERHTTVSAHPFLVDLPAGDYLFTIERGKEYHTLERQVQVGDQSLEITFRLQRWINMQRRGWYSGETHVHRRISELPNVMLAEDLNVAFPVTFWTIQAGQVPGLEPSTLRRQGPSPFGPRQDMGHRPIHVDREHVILPRNTEYEIFSVDGERHLLGAVFILNHTSRFETGMPPVSDIARQAHREGALLDLDKHSWPWSMMLVPIAGIDLYELANNSLWRTEFGFRNSPVAPADYMNVETDAGGMTERGWIEFGWENYYALLNCGFQISPTAGTASGVHPVPLGFGRVYVHLPRRFDVKDWLSGLKQGTSFVTTGPMLLARVDRRQAGETRRFPAGRRQQVKVVGSCLSDHPVDVIEVLVNGEVRRTITPANRLTAAGAYETRLSESIELDRTCWIAVRCLQHSPTGRYRFAHTAPWHFQFGEELIEPRREQIDELVKRVKDEIIRNQDRLSPEALAEFKQALAIYEQIAERVGKK